MWYPAENSRRQSCFPNVQHSDGKYDTQIIDIHDSTRKDFMNLPLIELTEL